MRAAFCRRTDDWAGNRCVTAGHTARQTRTTHGPALTAVDSHSQPGTQAGLGAIARWLLQRACTEQPNQHLAAVHYQPARLQPHWPTRSGLLNGGPLHEATNPRIASSKGSLSSRVVSILDSGAEVPGFKSQPRRCRVTVLGKLFTPTVPLFTKQRNW